MLAAKERETALMLPIVSCQRCSCRWRSSPSRGVVAGRGTQMHSAELSDNTGRT
jgi:hypothetical protein